MRRSAVVILLVAMTVIGSASRCDAVVAETVDFHPETHLWVGLGGFQFLKIGQGARPVAMGDAYAAVADDINAAFWNPAGLTDIRGTAWTATYTKWIVDSHVYSAAVAWNTGTARGGTLGATMVALRLLDIPETTIFQPQGTGQNVATGDVALGLVYALKLTDKFSFGARVSWIRQTLHTEAVTTVSIDVGTRFHTGFRSLRLAMAMRHYGPDKKVGDTKFFMPLYYHVGLAGEVYGEKGDPAYLTLTGEAAFAADYELRAHVGAELWLQNMIALRGGYKVNYDTDAYSLGAGLKYDIAGDRSLSVDVSYSDMGRFFNAPLRITVGGMF
jgi:hypothetical protein